PITWEGSGTDWAGLAFDPENDLLYVIGESTRDADDWGKPLVVIKAGEALIPSKAKFSNFFGDFGINGEVAGVCSVQGSVAAIYHDAEVPHGELGHWGPGSAFAFRSYLRLRIDIQLDEGIRAWVQLSNDGRQNHTSTVCYLPKPFG